MNDRARVTAPDAERPPPRASPVASAGPARRPALAHAVRVGRRDDPAEAAAERVAAAATRSDDRVVASARPGPLDPTVRALFQSRLGADLGAVMVHTGPPAAAAAEALGAAAFAVGDDIAFASGAYDPATARGRGLLAHELAHVVAERRRPGPPVLRRQTSEAVQEREARFPPEMVEPVVDDKDWLPAPDSLVSFVAENRLFVIPGQTFVYQVPPQLVSRARAVVGLPAVGHGASIVVSTGNGQAVMFDAGTGRGAHAAYSAELAAVQARMGVTEMTDLYISHGHTDHYNRWREVVETHRIPAENVVIADYQAPSAKGMQRAWQDFAATPLGRALRYDRVQMGSELVRRDPNARVYKVEFEHGDITFVYRVEAAVVTRLDQRPKRPGALLDAAAGLTVLTQQGTTFDVAILSDVRGRDILRLRDAMESEKPGSFAQAFRHVRAAVGFQHHLGAVNDAKDVAGVRAVLEVTATRGTFRALVQTDDAQMRPQLVEALNTLGVDVVTVGVPTGGEGSAILSTSEGVALRGGTTRLHAAPRQSREARARLGMLRDYEYALKRMGPGLEKSAELGDPAKLLEEVTNARIEVQRLYDEVAEETVGRLATDSPQAGTAPNRQLIAARLQQILDPSRVPKSLEREAGGMTVGERVELMANLIGNEEALRAEVLRTITTGEVTARLRQLIEIVSPEYARSVLGAPQPTAVGRRAALRQLNRQAQLAGAGWGGPFSRGAKVGRTGLALFELGRIAVEVAAERKKLRRVRTIQAINDFDWWTEKGALPPFAGIVDHYFGTDDEVFTVVDANGRFDATARKMLIARIEDLEAVELEAPVDDGSWLRFGYWVEERIRNYDEFDTHFARGNPPVRREGPINDAKWMLRVTHWSDWTGVSERWVEHEVLTRIMRRAGDRVVAGTRSAIERTWERRGRPLPEREPPQLAFRAEEQVTRLPGESPLESMRPTRHAHFTKGSDQELWSSFPQWRFMDWRNWSTEDPYLMVFESAPAPAGYVLVGGADVESYISIRRATITVYSDKSVLITREHDTAEEKDALLAAVEGRAERQEAARPVNNVVAVVRYFAYAPNESATGLAKVADLDFSEPRR
jgi:hypothetical protein